MIPVTKKILSGKIKLFLRDAYICGKTINKNSVMVLTKVRPLMVSITEAG